MIPTGHQETAIQKLQRLKVGALFMEPGTGKTFTTVNLINSSACDFVLWLCPFRCKESTLDEIAKGGGLNVEMRIEGIESLSHKQGRLYLELLQLIQSYKSVFIVCDESLKIKNIESTRTKRIIELGRASEFRLILNGTPMSRDIMDVWTQFEFLSPMILSMGKSQFMDTFCEYLSFKKKHMGKTTSYNIVKDYHNIEHLYNLITPYVFECDLEEEIETISITIQYQVSSEALAQYGKIKDKYLCDEMIYKMNGGIFLMLCQELQHSYCCEEGKLKKISTIIKKHGINNCIVYTKFISSREMVCQSFPDLQVLSYAMHSFGLNLQDKHVTIFFDQTFDYAHVIQARHRTYRMGQQNDCLYYNFVGSVKLEDIIHDNNLRKRSLLDRFKSEGSNLIKDLRNERV